MSARASELPAWRRTLGPDVAYAALERWGAAGELVHLGTSGSTVYRFEHDGMPWVLRLTHPGHRDLEDSASEVAFVAHCARAGAPVAAPLASRSGALVEAVEGIVASVFAWAEGERVVAGSPHWNEPMFRAWGEALAQIHEAAQGYEGPPRWDWRDERWIARAEEFLPADDAFSRAELLRLFAELDALPKGPGAYGHTHADFGPQNFAWDPRRGALTAFDFGNACRHWFVSDLAISLSTLRREPDRDRLRDWIVTGYTSVRPLDPHSWAALDSFLQLRILYVYLSRLDMFGSHPAPDQAAVLDTLRGFVRARFQWPHQR